MVIERLSGLNLWDSVVSQYREGLILANLAGVPILGHRTVRGTMYACISGAGVALWFLPIPFAENLIGVTYGIIATFLCVGGATSWLGHLLCSLVFEKAGYPLILTALVCLSSLLLLESNEQAIRIFNGLIVFAFTLGLYGRWRDLGILLKIQRDSERKNAILREMTDDGRG
jgi:hypothetical protein